MIGLWSCPRCGSLYTAVPQQDRSPRAPSVCGHCTVTLRPLATVPEKGDQRP